MWSTLQCKVPARKTRFLPAQSAFPSRPPENGRDARLHFADAFGQPLPAPTPHEGLRHHPRLRQEHRRQRALRRPARRPRRRVHRTRWTKPTSSSSTPAASSTRRRRNRSTRSSKRGGSRTTGRCKAVVGVGCMVQRHKDELDRRAARGRSLSRLVRDGSPDSRARGARADRRGRRAGRPSGRAACSPADCRMCAISRSAKGAITAARSAPFR